MCCLSGVGSSGSCPKVFYSPNSLILSPEDQMKTLFTFFFFFFLPSGSTPLASDNRGSTAREEERLVAGQRGSSEGCSQPQALTNQP